MHENREISSTPWSDDQGRSAKATSRNADMHVPEKSDCAVQPVNRPNKGGQLSAEAGEGRAQTSGVMTRQLKEAFFGSGRYPLSDYLFLILSSAWANVVPDTTGSKPVLVSS
jgi:hypothetical protein